MRWFQRNGGEDLHSDPPRFKIVESGIGCVAVDQDTGEQSSLLADMEAAKLWCEYRLVEPGEGEK